MVLREQLEAPEKKRFRSEKGIRWEAGRRKATGSYKS